MVTIYDLLEVDENATNEQIEAAYRKLIVEYHKSPKYSVKENEENEIILNKLKMAYEILINEEKREKYDKNLAKKRAEELIKNVSVPESSNDSNIKKSNEENKGNDIPSNNENLEINNQNINSNINNNEIESNETVQYDNIENDESEELSEEEHKKIKKAAKKEFKNNLKKAKKAEAEYNEAYNQAYKDYLRKSGYEVKEPWTFKRVIRVLIAIIIVFGTLYLLWLVPPINSALKKIYEGNVIIKSTVDMFVMLFNSIFGIFK